MNHKEEVWFWYQKGVKELNIKGIPSKRIFNKEYAEKYCSGIRILGASCSFNNKCTFPKCTNKLKI